MTSSSPPLRVAIWCAVSTKAQAADTKSSLADQERAGRAFADAIGGAVVRVYTVPGHTRNLIFWHNAESTMPAYRQLREDCEANAFDVLHAIDMDRLGRDPALANQVVSLVSHSGAEVYIASAPHQIGHATTGTRYVHAIQMVRASEDSSLRVHRSTSGKRARIAAGFPLIWPLGYLPIRDHNTGRTTGAKFDPQFAPVIRRITELFLAGQSYHAIAADLDQGTHKPLAAATWSAGTIRRIVLNDTYAGILTWHQAPTDADPSYPPYWDPDTYAAIRAERAARAATPRRKRLGGPLYGIAYCGRCGATMIRHRNPRSYSIVCSAHSRDTRICHPNHILESIVFEAIARYLKPLADPGALVAVLAPPNSDDPAAQLSIISRRITATDRQRERLALAYAAGQMDLAIYHAADLRLHDRLNDLHAKRANLTELTAARPSIDDIADAISALLPILPDLATSLPGSAMRAALSQLGLRVRIENGTVQSITLGSLQ